MRSEGRSTTVYLWRAALIIFYIFFNGLYFSKAISADVPKLVRIGVYDSNWNKRDITNKWQALENFVNRKLKDHSASIQVKLVRGTHDQFLKRMIDGDLNGAIISPFRYVVLDNFLKNEKLTVLAQIRRTEPLNETDQTNRIGLLSYRPRESYQSIVVMRHQSGDWEPHANARKKFKFLSTRSTSGYIYPMAFFRKRNLLTDNHIVAEPAIKEIFKDNLDKVLAVRDPWDIEQYYAILKGVEYKHMSPDQLISDFKSDTPSFQLLGTNDQQLTRYVPDRNIRAKKFTEVFRSEAIPFDPLVIRQNGPLESKINQAHLQAAFLATGTISSKTRQILFPLTKNAGSGTYKQRDPDIHDLIPASDETYDSVRRAGVLAAGGLILRLGLAEPEAENQVWNNLRKGIVRRLKYALMGDGRNAPRVYLEVVYYSSSELPNMIADLESGNVDIAELPAHHASKMLSQGYGPLAQVTYLDQGKAANYREFVTISTEGHNTLKNLAKDTKVAMTNERSSLGYWFPLESISKQNGIVPHARIVKAQDHYGVLRALTNGAGRSGKENFRATLGFMSKTQWNEINNVVNPLQLKMLNLVSGVDKHVPNPILVVSPRFCPCFENHELRLSKSVAMTAPLGAWTKLWKGFMSVMSISPPNVRTRFEVLRNVQTILDATQSGIRTGPVIKYGRVTKEVFGRLVDHDQVFNPDRTALLASVTLLILLGSFGVIIFAHRFGLAREREQVLILLPDEIGTLITHSQIAAVNLRRSPEQFRYILTDSGSSVKLADRLELSILRVMRANAEIELSEKPIEEQEKRVEYHNAIAALMTTLQDEVQKPIIEWRKSLEAMDFTKDDLTTTDLEPTLDNAKKFLDVVEKVLALGSKVVGA